MEHVFQSPGLLHESLCLLPQTQLSNPNSGISSPTTHTLPLCCTFPLLTWCHWNYHVIVQCLYPTPNFKFHEDRDYIVSSLDLRKGSKPKGTQYLLDAKVINVN